MEVAKAKVPGYQAKGQNRVIIIAKQLIKTRRSKTGTSSRRVNVKSSKLVS